MQTDLILYALIAAGLVFWLRSVLGTKHGEERERPNPFSVTQATEKKPPTRSMDDIVGDISEIGIWPILPKNVFIASKNVEMALDDIGRADSGFNLVKFSQAVQDAFAIVVESFGAGDRDTLKNLTEPQVYKSFERSLDKRRADGETMTSEIHAIRRAEIMNAKTDNKKAFITVRFIAEETCVIKNKDGAVVMGDPDRITEMNDIWVFAKPLKSSDPRWLVSETRDGDVKEEIRTPIPDSL